MAEPAIRAEVLSKRFGGVAALDDVTLRLAGGRVHAVVGENGAGKSTLARIVAGQLAPDAGRVDVAGEVALVPQELDLCGELTVAENIWLGREPVRLRRFVARRRMRSATRGLLDELGVAIDPDVRVRTLPVALQQLVLVARATARDARVLLLDEPTAVLEVGDARRLLDFLRRLRDEGRTIVYVSHRLPEIFSVADEVHVLRDGRHVVSGPIASFDERTLVGSMVGRELARARQAAPPEPERGAAERAPALAVHGLSGLGVHDVTLHVRPGEVLGVAGLPGSGRTGLLELLFGVRRRRAGSVEVDGRPAGHRSPAEAMRAGLAYVPGERLRQGVVGGMSVAANLALADLGAASRRGFVRPRRLAALARDAGEEVDLRYRDLGQPVRTLSGGNQQKVLLARWIHRRPTVLLLDEPTRGIDVGAKAEIYGIIGRMREAGVGVLLSSSELPELLSECDRIAVMAEGRLAGVLDARAADEESVLALALHTTADEARLLTTGGSS
jgi:ABC-type sugar transport system ATPase subunit